MAFVDISDKLSATGALGIKSTPLESGSADMGVLSGFTPSDHSSIHLP